MARNQRNKSRRTAPPQSRRTWNQGNGLRGTRGWATGLLSLAGGAGVGAALMYLLDPQAGSQRRQHAAQRAKEALESGGTVVGSALHSGGQALGSAWETVSGKAYGAAAAIGESIPNRKSLRRARHSARETADSWLDSANAYLPSFRRRQSGVSPTNASAMALSCLAVGLGSMWLLDPARGRGRRAWIGQKATRCINETGRFLNATGRHLRNKGKGYYYETTGAVRHAGEYLSDSTIAERVRSALGRVGLAAASSVGVRCHDGRVSLSGRCAADDVDRILTTVRDVQGVRGINNEMEVGDTFPSSTTPNMSNLSA